MEFISKELSEYCSRFSGDEEPILKELTRQTHLRTMQPRMLSGHIPGALLRMLVAITASKNILEIGTFTGYSALWMAAGLPNDGKIYTLDLNPEVTQIAGEFFNKSEHKEKIVSIQGDAIAEIPKLQITFDFIFLDADKERYLDLYELSLQKLRVGGLMVADNVLWSGKVLDLDANQDPDTMGIHEFNVRVSQDCRVEKIMLPIRDGMTLIRRIK